MGNDENNLSDIHEKALQLMEHGADISDEQLDQLRADERLREACLDLQAATMAFREDHDDTAVDDGPCAAGGLPPPLPCSSWREAPGGCRPIVPPPTTPTCRHMSPSCRATTRPVR